MLDNDNQSDMGMQDSDLTDDSQLTSNQVGQAGLREFFARIDFPAAKGEILAQAEAEGKQQIVRQLQRLPEREYQDENEIGDALAT